MSSAVDGEDGDEATLPVGEAFLQQLSGKTAEDLEKYVKVGKAAVNLTKEVLATSTENTDLYRQLRRELKDLSINYTETNELTQIAAEITQTMFKANLKFSNMRSNLIRTISYNLNQEQQYRRFVMYNISQYYGIEVELEERYSFAKRMVVQTSGDIKNALDDLTEVRGNITGFVGRLANLESTLESLADRQINELKTAIATNEGIAANAKIYILGVIPWTADESALDRANIALMTLKAKLAQANVYFSHVQAYVNWILNQTTTILSVTENNQNDIKSFEGVVRSADDNVMEFVNLYKKLPNKNFARNVLVSIDRTVSELAHRSIILRDQLTTDKYTRVKRSATESIDHLTNVTLIGETTLKKLPYQIEVETMRGTLAWTNDNIKRLSGAISKSLPNLDDEVLERLSKILIFFEYGVEILKELYHNFTNYHQNLAVGLKPIILSIIPENANIQVEDYFPSIVGNISQINADWYLFESGIKSTKVGLDTYLSNTVKNYDEVKSETSNDRYKTLLSRNFKAGVKKYLNDVQENIMRGFTQLENNTVERIFNFTYQFNTGTIVNNTVHYFSKMIKNSETSTYLTN